MTKYEALSHFGGSCAAAARALGISRQAVAQWPNDGPIPSLRIYEIRERLLIIADGKNQSPPFAASKA